MTDSGQAMPNLSKAMANLSETMPNSGEKKPSINIDIIGNKALK